MTKKWFLFIALLFSVCTIQATEISKKKATDTAVSIMSDRTGRSDLKITNVHAVSYQGMTAYYIIQFDEGWALISADDMSQPLIGYSDEGTFQTENQPENMRDMMDIYCQQIKRNSQLKGVPHKDWESLPTTEHMTRASDNGRVAPLIKVNWNQTGSYKKYCPKDDKGQAVVGCVAVGMAQAMSVAQYPPRPYGSHSYNSGTYGNIYIDYDQEPDYNWSDILSGANGRDDVARFLYHCGVAVNMEYGVDGSGTLTSYIPGALKRNFGYPESVKYYTRSGYEGDWEELILTELREGRAVAYNGHDSKKNYGHCFNLDGWDGTFFHVNWGWGGSNNGYFGVNALRDATMDMDYTSNQGVVVGIRPPSEKPSNIILSNNYVLADQPAGTEVGTVTVESEATDPTYTFTIKGEYSVLFHTYLPAPFEVVDGSLVTTESLSMDDYPEGINILITATNNENQYSVSRLFIIHVTNSSAVDTIFREEKRQTVSESFYSLTGQKTDISANGIVIVKRIFSDGTSETKKIINR